jgi:hypothetical protein
MTFRGHIRNGVVVLDERADLPDGTPVSVTAAVATTKKRRANAVQRMESVGPARAKLRQLAKKNRPPQTWYDETVNPFKSSRK